jgi:hypothetical protein
LTAAFQLLVRRRPLRELWVRGGPPFRLDAKGRAAAGVLMVLPAVMLVQALSAAQWLPAAWFVACLVGASPATYTLRQVRCSDAGLLLRWLAITTGTGVVVIAVTIFPALLASGQPLRPLSMLVTGLQWTLLYFPVTFLLEEATFVPWSARRARPLAARLTRVAVRAVRVRLVGAVAPAGHRC